MRFVLPFMMALFYYNYSGDQNRLHADISEIKDSQKAAWLKMDSIASKATGDYEYVLQHCCVNHGNNQ